MSSNSRFITRKEIGCANEVSHETVRRRERELGLDRCLDRTCRKPARYDRAAASERLRAFGMRVPE